MTSPEVFDFTKSTVITGVRSPQVCEDETDFAIVKFPNTLTGEPCIGLVTKSRYDGMEDVVVDRAHLEAVVSYKKDDHAEVDDHKDMVDIDVYDERLRRGVLKPLVAITIQELHPDTEHIDVEHIGVDVEGITLPENYLSVAGIVAATR